MKTYDILTIGGGPAGTTIAKILGGKMKVGVVRPEDHSMFYCAMPDAKQNKLTVRDLTKFSFSAQPYQSSFPANNPIVACAENIISKIKIEKESQETEEVLC